MINHFRVDSKLIHGQITTRLLAFKHCNRILIIDDVLAGDDAMRNIFSTVVPHNVKIHFRSMDDAVAALEKAQSSDNRYLVVMRTPQEALSLLERGYQFSCVLTCGQLTNDRGNGTAVLNGVNLLPEDEAAFQELADSGVSIVFDPTATENDAVPWKNIQKVLKTQGPAETQSNSHANLLRVFGILDLFLDDTDLALSVSEIQARLKIPFSTTYRLTSFLEKNGYLEKDKTSKNLRLGWKFFKLKVESSESHAQLFYRERVAPMLHSLAAKTGEASAVFVPCGHELRCIAHCDSLHSISVRFDDDQIRAVAADAVGRALLSLLNEQERARYPISSEISPEELTEYARAGCCVYSSDDGATGIAAPVTLNGRTLCILTVQGPSFRFTGAVLDAGTEELCLIAHQLSLEAETI